MDSLLLFTNAILNLHLHYITLSKNLTKRSDNVDSLRADSDC